MIELVGMKLILSMMERFQPRDLSTIPTVQTLVRAVLRFLQSIEIQQNPYKYHVYRYMNSGLLLRKAIQQFFGLAEN